MNLCYHTVLPQLSQEHSLESVLPHSPSTELFTREFTGICVTTQSFHRIFHKSIHLNLCYSTVLPQNFSQEHSLESVLLHCPSTEYSLESVLPHSPSTELFTRAFTCICVTAQSFHRGFTRAFTCICVTAQSFHRAFHKSIHLHLCYRTVLPQGFAQERSLESVLPHSLPTELFTRAFTCICVTPQTFHRAFHKSVHLLCVTAQSFNRAFHKSIHLHLCYPTVLPQSFSQELLLASVLPHSPSTELFTRAFTCICVTPQSFHRAFHKSVHLNQCYPTVLPQSFSQ